MLELDDKKSNRQIKKVRKIAIFLGVAILAVASAFGIIFLLNNLIDSGDINIGDTVIKSADILTNSKDIQEFIDKDKDNKLILEGKSAREKAEDDLILLAGLKFYAKKCNVGIDLSDKYISEYRNLDISEYRDLKEYQKTAIKIDYLKSRLINCVIRHRRYFSVTYMYANLDIDKFSEIESIFNGSILPLFRSNKSSKEISEYVKSRFPNTDTYDFRGESPAFNTFISGDDSNDNYDLVPMFLRDRAKNKDQFHDYFKKKGDFTQSTVVRANGEMGIYRLDQEEGEFSDWSDFLVDIKKRFLKDTALFSFDLFNNTYATQVNAQDGCAGDWSLANNYISVARGSLATHVIGINFTFRDSKTHKPLSGVSVHADQVGIPPQDAAGNITCRKNMTDKSNASGQAQLYANCFVGNPAVYFSVGGGKSGSFSYNLRGSRWSSQFAGVGTRAHWDANYSTKNGHGNISDGRGVITNLGDPSGINWFPGINGANLNIDVYVDQVPPPPPSEEDTISASSSATTQIKKSTDSNWSNNGNIIVKSGQTINFKHTVRGNFSSNFSKFYIGWNQNNRHASSRQTGKSNIGLGNRASGDIVVQGDSAGLKNNVRVTAYTARDADMGKTICENISYNWKLEYSYKKGTVIGNSPTHVITRNPSRDQNGSGQSQGKCFYVPYEYEIKPCVDATVGGTSYNCGADDIPAEPTETINLTPKLTGGGDKPVRGGSRYKITRWKVPHNYENIKTPNNESTENTENTCSVYSKAFAGANIADCGVAETGEFSRTSQKFNNPLPEMPEDAHVGTRYCVALSVSPYQMLGNENSAQQSSKTAWRHSRPICAIAVKKPHMAIWNNGVYSQSGIVTNKSRYKNTQFGSWVEYEAISNSKILRFTSASSHNSNSLTFSNDGSTVGEFSPNSRSSNQRIRQAIESRFPKGSGDGTFGKTFILEYKGNQRLYDYIMINAMDTRVIYADNLYIQGNQHYQKLGHQTIVIAKNIYIDKYVEKIDAILIADKVVTCAKDFKDDITIVNNSECSKPLIINGAILTNDLKSYRTGGDNKTGQPAEIYNQRPDMYFWSQRLGGGRNILKTTYTKELPVRY
ncbi:MAG: hypothetical protein Q4A21_03115 [bacterium]|nr:hypothetical protein [bacterium]